MIETFLLALIAALLVNGGLVGIYFIVKGGNRALKLFIPDKTNDR